VSADDADAESGCRITITKRTSKRGRPVSYYVCSTHRTRAGACTVKGSLRASEAHERVLRPAAALPEHERVDLA
jgi:hypothetical protein